MDSILISTECVHGWCFFTGSYDQLLRSPLPGSQGETGRDLGETHCHTILTRSGLWPQWWSDGPSLCAYYCPVVSIFIYTQVAAFKNKVFCGTYARGGDIFMSACQDRKVVRITVNLINIMIDMIIKENIENISTFPPDPNIWHIPDGFQIGPDHWSTGKKSKVVSHVLFANICNMFSILNTLFYQFTPKIGCRLERTRCGLESRRRSPCLLFLVW